MDTPVVTKERAPRRKGAVETRPSKLFEPIDIGPMRLRNRICTTPLGLSHYVDSDNSPTERLVAQMRERALGGAGLVCVETTFVEDCRPSKYGLAGFFSDHQIPRWAIVTDAIKTAGAKATIEIFERWHSDFPYDVGQLSVTEIENLIELYVRGAVRCRAAGFNAVTFQMAHGWPLSRFASPAANHRHDKYGSYSYVGAEIIRRCRAAVGSEIALILRFTVLEDWRGEVGVTLKIAMEELIPAFEDAGADALDCTLGLGPIAKTANDHWSQEHVYDPPGSKFEIFGTVKKAASKPVMGRSGINAPDVARRAVDEGYMDLVGIGRQMIADPHFPRKIRDGLEDEITHCIHCMYCGHQIPKAHVKALMHCTVNGSFGRELNTPVPAVIRSRRKIAVVGGGPAGMQAALSLADTGAAVTLYEKENELGGLNRLVPRMPNLLMSALRYATEDLERKLRRTGVTIRLGTMVTEDMALEDRIDALILATGSAPSIAAASGKSIVRPFTDYLAGQPVGKRVVVDGNGEGVEFAVSLARGGAEVTLVEPSARLEELPYDYLSRRMDGLREYLPSSGVRTMMGSRIAGIDGKMVRIMHCGGEVFEVKADTVLVAGRVPVRLDQARFTRLTPEAHMLGDCVSPRGLAEAMEGARAIAAALA